MSRVRSSCAGLLCALALVLCAPSVGLAQSDSAQVSGFVKDATGSAVPGATVVIKNEGTGFERKTSTNESGYYVFSAVPPGLYTVTAEASGFKKFVKTGNKLDPNIAATIDAHVEV